MDQSDRKWRTALVVGPLLGTPRGLRGMLLAAGVERVVHVEEGADALGILGTEPVEIVFAPWKIKNPPYREILAFLRKKGRHRRTPVVLLNDGMAQRDVVAAVKAGVAEILVLPAQSQAVREVLSRQQPSLSFEPRSRHGASR